MQGTAYAKKGTDHYVVNDSEHTMGTTEFRWQQHGQPQWRRRKQKGSKGCKGCPSTQPLAADIVARNEAQAHARTHAHTHASMWYAR